MNRPLGSIRKVIMEEYITHLIRAWKGDATAEFRVYAHMDSAQRLCRVLDKVFGQSWIMLSAEAGVMIGAGLRKSVLDCAQSKIGDFLLWCDQEDFKEELKQLKNELL